MWKSLQKSIIGSAALLIIASILSEPVTTPSLRLSTWTAAASVEPSPAPLNAVDATSLLAPGQLVQRELSTGEGHSYRVDLTSDQYMLVLLDQWGVRLGLTIYAPDGQVLAQAKCRESGPTPVSLATTAAGAYRLEVRALEKETTTGRYEVKIEQVREVTQKDQYRIAAEKVFIEGEELRAADRAESLREAIRKYGEALSFWSAVDERREIDNALKNIGEVYHRLNEPQTALAYYKQALLSSQKRNDRPMEGEILNDIGYAYLSLGDGQKAQQHCRQALKISQATRNRRGEAYALNNIGEIDYGFGNIQQSLVFYRQALLLWQELKDRRRQALVLLNSGYSYSDLGDMQKALEVYRQSLSLWRKVSDPRGQAITLTAIGRLYSRSGESQEALDLFNQAMQLIEPMGDQIEEARVFTGLGYVYERLGDKQKALDGYDQALRLFRDASYPNGEATVLHDMGGVFYSLGEYQKALDYFQQSLLMSRAIADQHIQSYDLRDMGMAYTALGFKEKALDYYRQALAINEAGNDRRGETDTLNLIGRIYDDWGEKQKALDYYDRALPLSRAAEYRFGESSTLYNIARAERDLGRLDDAHAHARAALGIVESLRAKVASQDLRASYFASVQQHYELEIDLLMRLHGRRPAEGFDAAALEASERARARSMLEILTEARADLREGTDPALLERERRLQQALNSKAERQMQVLNAPHRKEEAEAIAKEIDKITSEYEDVRAQIRATNPHYAALTQPQPLGLKEIQQQVLDDDNTLLLEYALGDEKSYLWAVTRDRISGYELPRRADIEEAARRVYELLKAHQPRPAETVAERQARAAAADAEYWQEAASLSRMILGPVTGQLQGRRLLIVADGALQYIPFEALTEPTTASQINTQAQAGEPERVGDPLPLIIDHEIVNLPSASTLAVLRRETAQRAPAPNTVAVLADPVFEKDDPRIPSEFRAQASALAGQGEGAEQTEVAELQQAVRDAGVPGAGASIPRLLASREEAEAIMQLTPSGAGLKAIGFDASRATATSPELRKYRIVHFATHGLLNSEHPELSGVILSLVDQEGQPIDGFLRLHDIYNLNLPADLVVLSACNTGLGKDVKGEGLIGLTRGFMYAGASGVMASLWKVDDEATAALMKEFYRGMLKDGLPPAAALRQAQLMMWKQKARRSPYYWAAFVLQGEYRERIAVNDHAQSHTGRIVAAAVMLLVFSIGGGLYAMKRRRRNTM